MAIATVPDFFQEESESALRAQVGWLTRAVGVDDAFFSALLRTAPSQFAVWRQSRAALSPDDVQTLHNLWQTTLHLLSFLNFQEDRLRALFVNAATAPDRDERSPLAPPWRGLTLRGFLENGGADAIGEVDRWVTGLRFGDPYAA